MKKSIVILSLIVVACAAAFRPASTPMQFVTLETRALSLPTPVDNKWSFPFIMFYGVKGNPYGVRNGAEWAFSAWTNMTVISSGTDTTSVYQAARDSANAYRLRTYPNVQ